MSLLVVALDVPSGEEALRLARALIPMSVVSRSGSSS